MTVYITLYFLGQYDALANLEVQYIDLQARLILYFEGSLIIV